MGLIGGSRLRLDGIRLRLVSLRLIRLAWIRRLVGLRRVVGIGRWLRLAGWLRATLRAIVIGGLGQWRLLPRSPSYRCIGWHLREYGPTASPEN